MSDFATLLGTFQGNLAKQNGNYKWHPRQLEHAKAIYDESIRQGVDPRMSLSIAWTESSWGGNSKNASLIGDQGYKGGTTPSIGAMQVQKNSAKDYLNMQSEWAEADRQRRESPTGEIDPALSAKIGVAYIRTGMDRFGTKSFADVAATHNGGYGTNKERYLPAVSTYVNKTMKNAALFGDGSKVDWKQPVALGDGVQMARLQAAPSQPVSPVATLSERRASAPAPAQAVVAPDQSAPQAPAPVTMAQGSVGGVDFEVPQLRDPLAFLGKPEKELSVDDLLAGYGGIPNYQKQTDDQMNELYNMVMKTYKEQVAIDG